VNFDVRRGEVFGISRRLGRRQEHADEAHDRLLDPIAGHVYIDGDDIVTADEATQARILRRFG